MKLDYYEVLGVSPEATGEEIRDAFKTLAVKCHPIHVKNAKKEEDIDRQFGQLSEAYQVLSNPEWRALYDKKRAEWDTANSDSSSVFEEEQDREVQNAAEVALGRNTLVVELKDKEVAGHPDLLLSLRCPFRVYYEVVEGAEVVADEEAFCEQLLAHHLSTESVSTTNRDPFGNVTKIVSSKIENDKNVYTITRNDKPINIGTMKCRTHGRSLLPYLELAGAMVAREEAGKRIDELAKQVFGPIIEAKMKAKKPKKKSRLLKKNPSASK